MAVPAIRELLRCGEGGERLFFFFFFMSYWFHWVNPIYETAEF